MTVAAMSGVPFKQQDAQTTGNGTVLAIPPSFRNHTWIISTPSGTTTGAIQIEASNDPADAGTWAPLTASPTTISNGADVIVQVTGLLNFVRARISTTISGGASPSVTVQYEGAKSY